MSPDLPVVPREVTAAATAPNLAASGVTAKVHIHKNVGMLGESKRKKRGISIPLQSKSENV